MKFEAFNFPVDAELTSTSSDTDRWKILIVDDEKELHQAAEFALQSFMFLGKTIELLHAHSGIEAMGYFQKNDDIAIAIIDLVMETPRAGMDLVHYIRKVICNHQIRLVIQTFQLGNGSEIDAIFDYDIDDYHDKANITAKTLRMLINGHLRAYRDLCTIDFQCNALGQIFCATANTQNAQSLEELAKSVLNQLKTILDVPKPELYCLAKPVISDLGVRTETLYATSDLRDAMIYSSLGLRTPVPDVVLSRMGHVLKTKKNMHFDDAYVTFNGGRDEINNNILYVRHDGMLSTVARQLLELYTQSVAITFENINLHHNLQNTQKELVYLLGEAVEAKSRETGAHVKRVAICSGKLAELVGLSPATVNLITLASPLHDIGKVAIPDNILHKHGELEPDEWETMKRHAEYGHDILMKSTDPVIQMGARIAYTHHERWDGTGYPRGLQGKMIPIEGRITALVDVFDALGSHRSYKIAWNTEQMREALLRGRGSHFDPLLVDIFLDNFCTFQAVREQFPDIC